MRWENENGTELQPQPDSVDQAKERMRLQIRETITLFCLLAFSDFHKAQHDVCMCTPPSSYHAVFVDLYEFCLP